MKVHPVVWVAVFFVLGTVALLAVVYPPLAEFTERCEDSGGVVIETRKGRFCIDSVAVLDVEL